MSDGHFEAKLSAKRETSAGIYLTFQVQPDDFTTGLATLRVGSALMMGWAEVVNVEVEKIDAPIAQHVLSDMEKQNRAQALADARSDEARAKDRKPFASLPLSQQAALRCQDNDFKLFLGASNAEDAAAKVRQMCGVTSRSEMTAGSKPGKEWLRLEGEYQAWLTDRNYADAFNRGGH